MLRYRFDRFEVQPTRRLLLADGRPLPLGARAGELLVALLEGRDRLLGKQELLERVWPGLDVEENNLATQVSTLRRVLGSEAIVTLPGLGYRFAMPVTEVDHDDDAVAAVAQQGGAASTVPKASSGQSFGALEWWPDQRAGRVGGQPLELGARAFDLLAQLIEQRHRVVPKQELLERVWPGLVVEENNLQVQVSALRRALGPQAIVTIPGCGYRFTLPEDAVAVGVAAPVPAAAVAPPAASIRRSNLAVAAEALVGRGADVETLSGWLTRHRIVTIVGAGGIGKTSLADAVARSRMGEFANGVWWVDLAAVDSAHKIALAIAAAIGLPLVDGDSAPLLVQALAHRQLMLVLDNCEHLCDAVAGLVRDLLAASPGVQVLATSRQSLKVAGEQVYRLDPLAVPPLGTALDAARRYGAIELLESRARAADRLFLLSAGNVECAIRLCQQLDGVALAIEMAAARLPLLGLTTLEASLGQRLRLLRHDGRAAPARQQTLQATLEWSHSLLGADERAVLRCLAVFAGSFNLDAARRVGTASGIDTWAVLDALSGLVDGSLLQVEQHDPPRYRLLETTRLYALERLTESGQAEAAHRQHSLAMAELADALDESYWHQPDDLWLANHACDYPDLEAAFERACRQGDADVGAATLDALFRLDHLRSAIVPIRAHAQSALMLMPRAAPVARARLQLRLAFYWMAAIEGLDRIQAASEACVSFAASGDHRRHFEALLFVATAQASAGDFAAAAQADAASRQLEDPAWPPRLRYIGAMFRGQVHALHGNATAYQDCVRAEIAFAEQAGSPRLAAQARGNLVDAVQMAGDWGEAVRLAHRTIEELRPLDMPATLAVCWINLLLAEVRHGDFEAARRTAEQALQPALQNDLIGYLLIHAALLSVHLGQAARAAQMLGFVEAWLARKKRPMEPGERRSADLAREAGEAALGRERWDELARSGSRLGEAQAAALVRELLGQPGATTSAYVAQPRQA